MNNKIILKVKVYDVIPMVIVIYRYNLPNTLTRLVDVDVESAAEGYNFPRRSRTQDNL